jgi:small subunit ribosomal protein S13
MARIAGVDLPRNKQGYIGLTYIFGIGRSRSLEILGKAGIDQFKKVIDWSDDDIRTIAQIIQADYKVEGELRSNM